MDGQMNLNKSNSKNISSKPSKALKQKLMKIVVPLCVLAKDYPEDISERSICVQSCGNLWPASFYKNSTSANIEFLDNGCIPEQLDTENFQLCCLPQLQAADYIYFTYITNDKFDDRLNTPLMSDTVRNCLRVDKINLTVGSLLQINYGTERYVLEVQDINKNKSNCLYLCNEFTKIYIRTKPQPFDKCLWNGFEEDLSKLSTLINNSLSDRTSYKTLLVTGPDWQQLRQIGDYLRVSYGFQLFDAYQSILSFDDPLFGLRKSFEEAIKCVPCIWWVQDMDCLQTVTDEADLVEVFVELLDSIDAKNFIVVGSAVKVEEIHSEIRQKNRFQETLHVLPPSLEHRKAFLKKGLRRHSKEVFDFIVQSTSRHLLSDLKELLFWIGFEAKGHAEVKMCLVENALKETYVTGLPVTHDLVKPPPVTMSDIVGYSNLKRDVILRLSSCLHKRDILKKLSVSLPTQSLWFGPPGCGKTMMVEAVAHELNLNVVSVLRKDVFSKYFGQSEKNLSLLFEKAKRLAPSIIHFKSFEGIAAGNSSSKSDVQSRVVSHLKVLLDGIHQLEENIFVVAETNKPSFLDKNVIRHGRFHNYRHFALPNSDDIKEAINKWLPKQFDSPTMDYACAELHGASMTEVKEFCYDVKVNIDYPVGEDIPIIEIIDDNIKKRTSQELIDECIEFASNFSCDISQ